jgi:hypothetical protein
MLYKPLFSFSKKLKGRKCDYILPEDIAPHFGGRDRLPDGECLLAKDHEDMHLSDIGDGSFVFWRFERDGYCEEGAPCITGEYCECADYREITRSECPRYMSVINHVTSLIIESFREQGVKVKIKIKK